MPEFTVPVRKEVPAYGEVTVEANSLEEACLKVRADIETHGELSQAGEVEFITDWTESHDLSVAEAKLPEGR